MATSNTQPCTAYFHSPSHPFSTVPALSVSINPPSTTMAGDTLILNCTVTLAAWAELSVGTVTLEWLDTDNTLLSTGGNITLGDQMEFFPMYTRALEFNPLQTSHEGQYTCQAMSNAEGITPATFYVDVTVQSELASFIKVSCVTAFTAGIYTVHNLNNLIVVTLMPLGNKYVALEVGFYNLGSFTLL